LSDEHRPGVGCAWTTRFCRVRARAGHGSTTIGGASRYSLVLANSEIPVFERRWAGRKRVVFVRPGGAATRIPDGSTRLEGGSVCVGSLVVVRPDRVVCDRTGGGSAMVNLSLDALRALWLLPGDSGSAVGVGGDDFLRTAANS